LRTNRRRALWIGCALAAALAGDRATAAPAKRQVPDYDGRADPPATAADVALWVPRVLLFPVYLTSEYLIRWPLGTATTAAERAHVPRILYDFLTFGPDHQAGVAPLISLDVGFKPSAGLYFFWDDFLAAGNDLRFRGSFSTGHWLAGTLTDRIHLREGRTLTFMVSAVRRPDHAFFGIGPHATQDNISRYGQDVIDGSGVFDARPWRTSRLQLGLGLRRSRVYHGNFGSDPSVEERAATGAFPVPDGFGETHAVEYHALSAALDSRLPRPAPGSGVRLELETEHANTLDGPLGAGWIRYGGAAGAFLDLNGHNRVVSCSLATLFVDPLGGQVIPFTDLVSLGGAVAARGFFPGRLSDRSAAIATLAYQWPIWTWLDGSIQAAVGNVFGAHLRGFDPSALRFSGVIGFESSGSRDSSFEVLVGFGTETFGEGAKADSIRLVLGTNRGF
jgi:hypothetical protein